MDLNEIVVFSRVVETGSFTAAAHSLGLPKSTVSRKIAQLEERLDARLLQRTTRKLSLTEIGKSYYERCKKIVSEIADAEQMVADLQAAPRGLLRVTAPVDVGGLILGSIIADFLVERPEIQIELVLSDRTFDLVDERLDVGIRFGPLPDSSLVARRLGEVTGYLVAAPAYLARRGTPARPEQLKDHDVVNFVPVRRLQSWTLLGPRNATMELQPGSRFTTNGMIAAREAVRGGLGISMLGDFAIHDDVASGRLVRVLPGWTAFSAELFAVYPSTRNLSPKLKEFLAFLTGKLTPCPWQMR